MDENTSEKPEDDVNILEATKSEEIDQCEEFEPYTTQDLEELLEDETPTTELIETDTDTLVTEYHQNDADTASAEAAGEKPRIILTLRTSENDPEAYFSTSSIQLKANSNDSSRGRTVQDATFTDTANMDAANKRTLRRMSSSKESVLQNAIALKEKSFGLPEATSYKKKSPKNADKVQRQSHPIKVKSPKSLITNFFSEKTKLPETIAAAASSDSLLAVEDCEQITVVHPTTTEHYVMSVDNGSYSEAEMNGNVYNNGVSSSDHHYSGRTNLMAMFDRNMKPKRRKRYFKGLSYSFNNNKNKYKKKKLLPGGGSRGGKFEISESSEQDTDSQNTIINNGEHDEIDG